MLLRILKKGIEQPGFINRSNFLLRWDISPTCRGFIGYEYETTRGARFFMQTPSKVVQGKGLFLSRKYQFSVIFSAHSMIKVYVCILQEFNKTL